jgi:ADP-ribose pyrophosphatase
MKPWKRIEPTTVTKLGWRTVVTKTFQDNRGHIHNFDTVSTEGSRCAAVIALTEDNQAIITRQFRVGPEIILDELPGGGVGQDEDPQAAAERELLEETGYKLKVMLDLGSYCRDAYTNETSHTFLRLVAARSLSHNSITKRKSRYGLCRFLNCSNLHKVVK